MKTKKERTIEAIRKTIEKFKDPEGQTFLSSKHCAICNIHKNKINCECHGCPFANREANEGCVDDNPYFEIYKLRQVEPMEKIIEENRYLFDACVDLLESWLPEIMEHPPEHFTREGWVPFGLKE